MDGILTPLLLGILEGLTEFLPVSSTGHLLLAGHFFGLSEPAVFIVLIQLGAILAVITVYFAKLFELLRDALQGKRGAWLFALNVVLASFPAALAGVMFHDYIQGVIYETPLVICLTLLIGGIILLVVDRLPLKPRYTDIYTYPWHLALIVGIFQMLALIPGVSRSGATIVGSLLFGTDKRSAAEFTFFIALPIMIGAFGYDFYKNREIIMSSGIGLDILIGFVASFIIGTLVVRYLLQFVSSHGFSLFAWWRIIVGGAGLVALLAMGS
ncbi:MAG: undecaprenyl-diphosphate phosphatase [Hyphomicrobiaceae bacterium]|nr:undecaprenyl-diphosphate phosphatase [Hyphomicrobiaceae bacterium]MCC0023916.1 undecaprenyl-diphosphate phosphatase [Hyphomicrobiaceae bacterium]